MSEESCYCSSEKKYSECCGVYLEESDVYPDNCEALMRSRYTAFIKGKTRYLLDSWHPDTRPELDSEPSNWISLTILHAGEPHLDDEDKVWCEVEFTAKLLYDKNKLDTLHELSHFEKVGGKWLYHSGDFLEGTKENEKVKNSQPCPCDSGKLFKNCRH